MKYYKTNRGYVAIDPHKKVYKNRVLVPELVCGRGAYSYRKNKYNLRVPVIGDQVYRLSDLGNEIPPNQIEAEWRERLTENLIGSDDDSAARFLARVLVFWVVGMVIGGFLYLIR